MKFNQKEFAKTHTQSNQMLNAMLEAKQRSGLSQKAIAQRIGMPQSNVSRIEHSEGVSFNTFVEYLSACGFNFTINLQPLYPLEEKE